ncbi:MAG: secretion protein F, partial [Lachnospiraceae bacterium]|nr:secretion protein F [Lachnospiraceae bacterium]
IQQLLDSEVTEVYLQQQAHVKRLGEEASAKLLLPMGMMLILVFAVLILPAMFSLQLS